MSPRRGKTILIAALALAGALAGCSQPPPPPRVAPIGFALPSPRVVAGLRRVVFVELHGGRACSPGIARSTTHALADAVAARKLFHVDVLHREDAACRDLPLDRLDALTLEELSLIRKTLRCDAVMFGRITRFAPFPRMQLGLYVKLLDLKKGMLAWGVDHVWDSTEREVERRIQWYFCTEVRDGYEPIGHDLVLKSPRAFQRFVSHEAAGTLPEGRARSRRKASRATAADRREPADVAPRRVEMPEAPVGPGKTLSRIRPEAR